MRIRMLGLAGAVLAPVLLAGCADYGPPPPPPPPDYVGETWGQHVRRCLRHYPNYNPRTDRIERPYGPVPCRL